MSELEFRRGVVVSLAEKLEELDLSPEERGLLRAIFAAAGALVAEVSSQDAEEYARLRDQLHHAFLPESGETFKICHCRIT